MASNLKIKTIFTAIDKMTAPIKKMQSKISAFSGKSGKALNNFSKQTKRSTGALGGMLKTFALVTAVSIFTRAVKDAINVGKEFEKTMDSVASKFDDLTPENLIAIERAAREVGATTEFTATQAAEGLEFLALAGFTADQAIAALPKTVDLATAANIDLARASDIATDSLGAFGMASDDATLQASNLENIMDAMLATSSGANTSLEELFDSVVDGGNVFVKTGQTMHTFLALAGRLGDAGIKGGKSGRKLRNMMLRLTAPTGEAAKELKKLNIDIADSDGNFRDITDVIGDFKTGLAKLTPVQSAAAVSTIFGKEQVAAFNVLLDVGADKLKAFRARLEDSTGKTKEMAAMMRDNLNGQLKSLNSRFESIKIEVFNILLPILVKVVGLMTMLATAANDFLFANNNLLSSGIMEFFSLIGFIIGSVFQIVKKLVGMFVRMFQEQEGVKSLKMAFEQLKQTLGSVFEGLGEIFGAIESTGAFDIMISSIIFLVNVLTILLKILIPIIKVIVFLEKIVAAVITPIVKIVKTVAGLLVKLTSFFASIGGIDAKVESDMSGGGLVSSQQAALQQQGGQNSQVDVNFNNTPNGTRVKQSGNVDNLNLNVSSQPVLGS